MLTHRGHLHFFTIAKPQLRSLGEAASWLVSGHVNGDVTTNPVRASYPSDNDLDVHQRRRGRSTSTKSTRICS